MLHRLLAERAERLDRRETRAPLPDLVRLPQLNVQRPELGVVGHDEFVRADGEESPRALAVPMDVDGELFVPLLEAPCDAVCGVRVAAVGRQHQ